MGVSKREEQMWREHYAEDARRWVYLPWSLLGVFEAIMNVQDYTPSRKLQQMRWAMDAYNDAAAEAYGRHRTSCPEHTED